MNALESVCSMCASMSDGAPSSLEDMNTLSIAISDLLSAPVPIADGNLARLLSLLPATIDHHQSALIVDHITSPYRPHPSPALLLRFLDWAQRSPQRPPISISTPVTIIIALLAAVAHNQRTIIPDLIARLDAFGIPHISTIPITLAIMNCQWLVAEQHITAVNAVHYLLEGLLTGIALPSCHHSWPTPCSSCTTSFLDAAERHLADPFSKMAPRLCRALSHLLRLTGEQTREDVIMRLHSFTNDTYACVDQMAGGSDDIRAAMTQPTTTLRAVLARMFLSVVVVASVAVTANRTAITMTTDMLSMLEFARVRFSVYGRLFLALMEAGVKKESGIADEYIDTYVMVGGGNSTQNTIVGRARQLFNLSILQLWSVACSHDHFHRIILPFVGTHFFSTDTSFAFKAHRAFCARFMYDPADMRRLAPLYIAKVAEAYPLRVNAIVLRHAFTAVMSALDENDALLLYIFNVLVERSRALILLPGNVSACQAAIDCMARCMQHLHYQFIGEGLRMTDGLLVEMSDPAMRVAALASFQASFSSDSCDVYIKDTCVRWYFDTLRRLSVPPTDVIAYVKQLSAKLLKLSAQRGR